MGGRPARRKPLPVKDLRRLVRAKRVPLFPQNPHNKKNNNYQPNKSNHFVNPQGRKSRTPNGGMRVTHPESTRQQRRERASQPF